MNSTKNLGFKLAMLLVALFSMNYAAAQTISASLSIPTTVVKDYEVFQLPIALSNPDSKVGAVDFDITIDPNLEWGDGENTDPAINTERLTKGTHKVSIKIVSETEATVVVRSQTGEDFEGTEGDIIYIPLKVKKPAIVDEEDPEAVEPINVEEGATLGVNLKNINFSNGSGTATGKQNEADGVVAFEPFSYKAYLTPNPLQIYPAGKVTVDFNLDNIVTVEEDMSAPVKGLTVLLTLPEGLSIDKNSILENTDRLFSRASVLCRDRGNGVWVFFVSDDVNNNPLKSGVNTGKLFSFDLVGAENLSLENVSIKVSDLEISALVEQEVIMGECEDCMLTNTSLLLGNEKAYEAVIAALDQLQEDYEAAVAETEAAYPDFDLTEWKEMIPAKINEVKEGAAQALAAANLDGQEFNYPFAAEDIQGMIDEMKKAPAAAALEAANQAAYDKVVEAIDAVEASYNEALAELKESNPDFDTTEWEEMITKAIEEAKTGAEQALKAANENDETFTFAFDGADIQNMIDEMKAAPAKAALIAANEAAYNEIIAVLDEVQAKYDETVSAIKLLYPDYDLTDWEEIIPTQIEEQRTGAKQALDGANEEGVEFFYPFDGGEYLYGMIEEMKNAPKADADQAALEAANLKACQAVLESLDALQASYEDALAEIKDNNPEFDSAEWEEIIMGAINQTREGAEQALEAANEDGVEYNFAFDGEEIEAMIAEMQAQAKAEADKAALEAANREACDKVLESIDALQADYEDALAAIKESNPEFDSAEYESIITNAIDEAKTGAEQALEAANEDGVEYSFVFDGADIKAMIDQMVADAETSAVDAIAAEVANGKAMIFTLDGKQHVRPVSGEVNVIVRQNSTSKIFIK